MPRPETIQKRNNGRQLIRDLNRLMDDERYLDALDEIDASQTTAAEAGRDPMAYFRGKGVDIPRGIQIDTVERSSPVRITFSGFGIRITIQW